MNILDRNDEFDRREEEAGGPQRIIADLVHDAHWQRMLSIATMLTVVLDIVFSTVLVFAIHSLDRQQAVQTRTSRQVVVNQRGIQVAQNRITDAARSKAVFDHTACLRSRANITEIIRTDTALAAYLDSVRPRTATLTHLVQIYRDVHLSTPVC